MNNNILILVAAVAAVVMLNKAKAATAPAGSKSAPAAVNNANGALWSALIGGGWKAIADAKNGDGSPAFLMTNPFGQIVTSDGKPVGQEYSDLFPATVGGFMPVDLSMGGTDYLSQIGMGNW